MHQIKSAFWVGFFLFEVGPTGPTTLVPDPFGFVTPPKSAFARFFFAFCYGVISGFLGFESGTMTGLFEETDCTCYCFGPEIPLWGLDYKNIYFSYCFSYWKGNDEWIGFDVGLYSYSLSFVSKVYLTRLCWYFLAPFFKAFYTYPSRNPKSSSKLT